MGIDAVFGTASGILAPFAELLMNETILGIISLLFCLVKFEGWLNRRVTLGAYEQELLLEKDKRDLRKKVMTGAYTEDLNFDEIAKFLKDRAGKSDEDFLDILGDELDKFDMRKWK